jgi:NAD+ kinase
MMVLIYGQVYKPNHRECLIEVLGALDKKGITPYAYRPYWDQVEPEVLEFKGIEAFQDFETTPVDVVLAFGGDGTMLAAISLINEYQVPVMGINLGRLGFLSSIEDKFAAYAVSELAKGNYRYDERTMIRLETNADIFPGCKIALNDFTLHKRDNSSMIIIHTYINGELLNSFWADGLIVATPTGSTGYSLSCGGPIVFPNSNNFIITPVAPHNLSVRPIVVPDSSVISFEIEGRADSYLCTLDSRFEAVTSEHKLTIRKAVVATRFIQLYNYSFLRTLHDKLTWGKDSRN